MRKSILLTVLVALFSFQGIMAQNIANGDLESWNLVPFDQPNNFNHSNNFFQGQLAPFDPSVVRTSDANSGSFAAQLSTALFFGNPAAPGVIGIFNNDLFTDAISPGDTFTQRPDSITGFYKYTSGGAFTFPGLTITQDRFTVYALLTRTISPGVKDTVGEVNWESPSASVPNYTRFSQPFTYFSSATPDSITLIISSSTLTGVTTLGFASVPGSEAFVDDIDFVYNVTAQPIPTVSEWGMIFLATFLCIGTALFYHRSFGSSLA